MRLVSLLLIFQCLASLVFALPLPARINSSGLSTRGVALLYSSSLQRRLEHNQLHQHHAESEVTFHEGDSEFKLNIQSISITPPIDVAHKSLYKVVTRHDHNYHDSIVYCFTEEQLQTFKSRYPSQVKAHGQFGGLQYVITFLKASSYT